MRLEPLGIDPLARPADRLGQDEGQDRRGQPRRTDDEERQVPAQLRRDDRAQADPQGAADRHRQVEGRHHPGPLLAGEQVEQDRRRDDAVGRLADPQQAPGQRQLAVAARQPAADRRQAPDADPQAEQPGPPVSVAQPAHDRAEQRVADQEDAGQQAPLGIR